MKSVREMFMYFSYTYRKISYQKKQALVCVVMSNFFLSLLCKSWFPIYMQRRNIGVILMMILVWVPVHSLTQKALFLR